jgi:hypothetical protein
MRSGPVSFGRAGVTELRPARAETHASGNGAISELSLQENSMKTLTDVEVEEVSGAFTIVDGMNYGMAFGGMGGAIIGYVATGTLTGAAYGAAGFGAIGGAVGAAFGGGWAIGTMIRHALQ